MTSIFSILLSLARLSSAQYSLPTLAGVIYCQNASLSEVPRFRVIPRAKVEVLCNDFFQPRVVKSATTDNRGLYSFNLGRSLEDCFIEVMLPDGSCTFNPPGGVIQFPIIPIKSTSGQVVDYIPGTPIYLAR
ncbi:pollen Ole e 1 allergen and extensin family protein [Striga asiatica]|uniref:Pollen Ole e 1 allergen and extensin family protein n=1 Tax=Striga asiatica TaxID=4170 RepID=A0A5A7P6L9_STRAF|nr:pollen Ole e 1 allergen and extensin family protein [Striga asiatica]